MLNQRVADEIAGLVARHRYRVEDGRDAVRCAERASAERNAQLRAESAERRAALAELGVRAEPGARNHQRAAPRRNEIRLEIEDDEQPPASRASAPRRPVVDDDEDFSAGSWLR